MKLALKLDKLYCCERCHAVFLFQSDVEDHARMCGHRQVREMDLP
ncbi:MAG: hypothetical protein ACREAW_04820 [Nitrososphaera sp.]|jgi:hypothetical protein